MSRSFICGLIVGIAVLIAGVSAGSQIQERNSKETEAQRELKLFEKEVVDATPTRLGVLTRRQQSHSRVYAGYGYKVQTRKTISEFIAHPEGKVIAIDFGIGLGPAQKEPQNPEEYFARLANESDAIVRGRVIQKVSQISDDDSFIFTDYDVAVMEVIKDNTTSPLATDMNIVVTRPGGKILVDGIVVQFTDHYFLPLPVDNKDVILFLNYLPETGVYQASRDNGSFQVDGEILRPLTEARFPPGVLRDSNSFLQTVRALQGK